MVKVGAVKTVLLSCVCRQPEIFDPVEKFSVVLFLIFLCFLIVFVMLLPNLQLLELSFLLAMWPTNMLVVVATEAMLLSK